MIRIAIGICDFKKNKHFQANVKVSTFYLMQNIPMAIQQGNAVCIRGCPKSRSLTSKK